MKRFAAVLRVGCICALTSAAVAAVPHIMNMQGILKDGVGNPVADGSYNVVFTVYDAAAFGTALWAETTLVTTTDGLFNVELGSANPMPDTAFNDSNRWLGIQVWPDLEMSPRQKLASVAYSFRAEPWTSSGQHILRSYGNVAIGAPFVVNSIKLDVRNMGGAHAATQIGVRTNVDNSGVGGVRGVSIAAISGGDGVPEGIVADAIGSPTTIGEVTGGFIRGTSNSPAFSQGIYADGTHNASGDAYGGNFRAYQNVSGTAYGLSSAAYANSGVAIGMSGDGVGTSASYGVQGFANSSTSNAYGGYFSGVGVTGSTGVYGNGATYGVQGISMSAGYGVYGDGFYGVYGSSSIGGTGVVGSSPGSTGVSGDGGFTGLGIGVLGRASGVGSYAGYFDGDFLATGTKSAAVKTESGRYHLMYAQESPENWFEDFGTARIVRGRVVVNLDPMFAQTVNTRIDYHVFLTPEGDCRGLYVTGKAPGSFEIRELQGGTSSLSVSYRVVAKRRGYENVRLPEMSGPEPETLRMQAEKAASEHEKQRVLDRAAAEENLSRRAAQSGQHHVAPVNTGDQAEDR